MHNAPSVAYPVGRSRIWAGLAAGLWLAGAAVCALVLRAMDDLTGWRAMLLAAAVLAAGLGAATGWWCAAAGTLEWNGEGWTRHGHGHGHTVAAGTPTVALDGQAFLLLRWQALPGAHMSAPGKAWRRQRREWLWLDRAQAPQRWDGLRRAVYSRAITDAPPGHTPDVAIP